MLNRWIDNLINGSPHKEPRVLFFVPYGAWYVHNQLDAVISCALNVRRVPVTAIVCNGIYQRIGTPCYAVKNEGNTNQACLDCGVRGQQLFQALHTPTIQLKQFIDVGAIDAMYNTLATLSLEELLEVRVHDFDVGAKMCGPVCSYHRVTLRSFSEPDVLDTLRLYISYAIATYHATTKLYKEFNPSHVFMWNGAGYAHSGAFSAARALGINVITHERGLFDGAFMLTSNDVAGGPHFYMTYGKSWEEIPQTIEESVRVRNYFLDRERGENTNFRSYYSFKTEDSEIRSTLDIPSDAEILSVYTSSEWELGYQPEHFHKLSEQMTCIEKLIDIFASDPAFKNRYLIIRHHPSIGFGPGGITRQMDLLDIVYQHTRKASRNVRIIMPDERITSYAILWNSAACISFGSTIRHEATARGIPSASIDSLFLSQGVSHVINDYSIRGLTNLTESLFAHSRNFTIEGLRRLYRFAHTFYFKHSVKFQSVGIKNNYEMDIRIKSHEDLLPGKDPVLDRVCDHITKGESLYVLPTRAEWTRSQSEENTFLTEELERLNTYRNQVHQASKARLAERALPPTVHIFDLKVPEVQSDFLKLSWHRQFYRNMNQSSVAIDTTNQLTQIRELLQNLPDEEFVSIITSPYHYDERWLQSSAETLLKERTKKGITCDAWLTYDNKIKSLLLCRNQSIVNYRDAVALFPHLRHAAIQLSLGFFRVSGLKSILDSLLVAPTTNVSEELFSRLMNGKDILFQSLPMMRIDGKCNLD